MKKLLSIFLVSLFIIQAPLRAERSYYEKAADSVLAPVALATLGYQRAGLVGALYGLAIGCGDEALVQTGVAAKHYLTAGVLGASAMSSFKTAALLAKGIGFLTGLLLATGKLTPLLDKAGSAFSTGIMAQAYGGTKWGLGGAACGMIDEALLHHNVTSKPYLSNLVIGIATTSVVAPWLYKIACLTPSLGLYAESAALSLNSLPMKEIIGVGIGSVVSTLQTNGLAKSPVQLGEELYAMFARLVDKDTLDSLIEKQAIALVASKILFVTMTQRLNGYYQDVNSGYEALARPEDEATQAKFWGALLPLLTFIPLHFGAEVIAGLINGYFSERLNNQVRDNFRDRYLEGETALKLGMDKNSTVLVEKMYDNLREATLEGSQVLGSSLSTATSGSYNAMFLAQAKSLDMIVLVWLYASISQVATGSLTALTQGYTPRLNEEWQLVNDYRKELMKEPHLIIPADKIRLVRAKLERAIERVISLQTKQQRAQSLLNAWNMIQGVIDWVVLKNALVASKIMNGDLRFDQRFIVSQAVDDVSGALSWGVKNARALAQIDLALSSINALLDKIADKSTKTGQLIDYSQGPSDEVSIDISNVSVGVESTLLVQEPHLLLKKAIYAASGRSGCGKSAFLSKLKGVVHNQFWASGQVRYGTPGGGAPKTMLVTQKDYLTPNATLLELILSAPASDFDVQTKKTQAIALLTELDFDATHDLEKLNQWLSEENNYGKMLSGGQFKKVSIVAALMAKPDILILDEVFNGMDKKVIQVAQRMLKRDLPNTLIIVVDHHAFDNNATGFYDHELHFADKKIEVRKVTQNATLLEGSADDLLSQQN